MVLGQVTLKNGPCVKADKGTVEMKANGFELQKGVKQTNVDTLTRDQ